MRIKKELLFGLMSSPIAGESQSRLAGLSGKIKNFREATLILIILIIGTVMSFLSPYFLTWGNMRAVMLSFSTEGIVAVGMTMLLIVGGFDLSVGAVMCFAMVVAGKLFLLGMNPWLAALLGIATCSVIGMIMGFFVTRVGLSHFITTLAFLGIARGACFIVTKGTPLSLYSLPKSFKFIGQGNVYGVPFVILIFVVVVIIADYILRKTTIFRKVYYVGSNEKAAIYSGIDAKKVKFWVTVACSTLTGLAGIIFMSKFGSAPPTFGVGVELNVIAAAVIGGASLNGGEGTVYGAVLGIALLSVVSSSLILLNVSSYWQEAIKGVILLSAVTMDHYLNVKRA
jgi:ribose transport system permease protein